MCNKKKISTNWCKTALVLQWQVIFVGVLTVCVSFFLSFFLKLIMSIRILLVIISLTDWLSLTHSHSLSLDRSLTHSIAHSLDRPLTHSIAHSLTHSIDRSLTHSLTHSHTNPLAHSHTHTLARSLIHSFIHSLTHPVEPWTNVDFSTMKHVGIQIPRKLFLISLIKKCLKTTQAQCRQYINPLDTCRNNNIITPKRRRFYVIMTLLLRRVSAWKPRAPICIWSHHFAFVNTRIFPLWRHSNEQG